MSDFVPGLEGVVAFETEIAEPDKEGGALRYRGVDIEDLVGRVPFGNVWGLLVDGEFDPGLPPAEPFPIPVHSGDIRVDVQSALAMLAPDWGLEPLLRHRRRAGPRRPRPGRGDGAVVRRPVRPRPRPADGAADARSTRRSTIAERFMIRWRGEPDPEHVKAVDAYFISAAEHGMNASTFTARVITSTGADVAAALSGAIGAMSGPLHGGAPSRVLGMIEEVEQHRRRRRLRQGLLDNGERLMGFGHRVYRAEDPRARVLRRTAQRARRPALRGRRGAGEGRAGRAARAPPRPGARDQRGVLGGDRARLRRGAGAHVHLDVHLCPHGRLVRAHPRAEAHRPADPPVGALRRARRRASPRRSRAGTPSRSRPPATSQLTTAQAADAASRPRPARIRDRRTPPGTVAHDHAARFGGAGVRPRCGPADIGAARAYPRRHGCRPDSTS